MTHFVDANAFRVWHTALMPVPTYDQLIEPLLRILADHPDGTRTTVIYQLVAERVGLTDEDKGELLPSGHQPVYQNRIGWAHNRLKRGGLSSSLRRGYWQLTPEGFVYAANHESGILVEELHRLMYVSQDLRLRESEGDEVVAMSPGDVGPVAGSPEERIERALNELEESLASDLLDAIAGASPAFFEYLVLDVLHALGYGLDRGSLHPVGRSGDGGIDGIISLDRLGLEKVYIQAKRWKNNVGRPEIQSFFGALAGHRAKKGVFLTTSKFTKEARDYAAQVSDSLVLVNGARLAQLMIEYRVGVSHKTLRIAKLDSDYFEEP